MIDTAAKRRGSLGFMCPPPVPDGVVDRRVDGRSLMWIYNGLIGVVVIVNPLIESFKSIFLQNVNLRSIEIRTDTIKTIEIRAEHFRSL